MLRVLFVLQRILEHQLTSDDSAFFFHLYRAGPLVDVVRLLGRFNGSICRFMDASQRPFQHGGLPGVFRKVPGH